MMKKIILTLIASIAVVVGIVVIDNNPISIDQINQELSSTPSAAGGTTYYVCDTGDDEYIGTTIDKPLRTFDKAMSKFKSLYAGDSILFCRGGHFSVNNYVALFNTNFTAQNPGVIGDYLAPGSFGNESLPIISNTNNGVFYFNTRNTLVPDGGLIIQNLSLFGKGKSRGIYFLNGYSDVKIRNVLIDGFRVGISIGNGASSSRMSLTDSIVRNNTEQGWLGGSHDLLIENNYFYNNGFGGKHNSYFYHNVYVSNNELSPNKNVIVRGNTLYKSAMVNGKCGGASFVVHGEIENLLIENNLIKEDKGAVTQFCYGLGVGPAYSSAESFKDVTIRNNRLVNVGRVGISGGSLVGAVIDNNYIIDQGEILDEGILVPEEKNSNDAKSQNIKITRNTIIANNSYVRGIVIGGSFPFIVENNTISLYAESENKECFKKIDANTDTNTDANICKTHATIPSVPWEDESQATAEAQAAEAQAAEAQAAQVAAEAQAAEAQAAEAQAAEAQAAQVAAEAQAAVEEAKNNALQAAERVKNASEQAAVDAARSEEAIAVAEAAEAFASAISAKADVDALSQRTRLGAVTRTGSSRVTSGLNIVSQSDVINSRSKMTDNPENCRASSAGRCLLK